MTASTFNNGRGPGGNRPGGGGSGGSARLPARGLLGPGRVGRSDAQAITTPVESPTQLAVRRLKEDRLAQLGAVLLTIVVCMCLATPLFEKYWAGRTANEQNIGGKVMIDGKPTEVVSIRGIPNVGPGFRKEYTLGADALGRDVFMRVLAGGAVSLTIGLGGAIITIFLGTIIGTVAGYFGGRTDFFVSQGVDILLAFPATVFAIALSTSLASSGGVGFIQRGSPMLPLMVIGVLGGPYFARIIRSRAIDIGGREFVEASKALGAPNKRIIVHEMLPHLNTTIIAYFGVLVSANIIAEAGLSFLGVGVLPPTPSWGNIIADGRIFYSTAWWVAMFPGVFIIITVLGVNLIGEGLKNAFDPKSGGR